MTDDKRIVFLSICCASRVCQYFYLVKTDPTCMDIDIYFKRSIR